MSNQTYKFKGSLKNAIKNLIRFLILTLKVIPYKLGIKSKESGKLQEIDEQIWNWRTIKWNEDGYWFLTPMPSDKELDDYYSATYWNSFRGGKKFLLSLRDLNHFMEIKQLYPEKQFSRVLNFGAGHGGISILFHTAGSSVTNVEPSSLDLGLDWQCFKRIRDVEGSYDLIYGSHSLEHVTDVEEFFRHVDKLLSPSGVMYFEVPNCHIDNQRSYPGGKITIPHTYYFTRKFFENLPYKVILNSTYRIQKMEMNLL